MQELQEVSPCSWPWGEMFFYIVVYELVWNRLKLLMYEHMCSTCTIDILFPTTRSLHHVNNSFSHVEVSYFPPWKNHIYFSIRSSFCNFLSYQQSGLGQADSATSPKYHKFCFPKGERFLLSYLSTSCMFLFFIIRIINTIFIPTLRAGLTI